MSIILDYDEFGIYSNKEDIQNYIESLFIGGIEDESEIYNMCIEKFGEIYIKGKNLLTKLAKLQKIFNIKCLVIKTGSKGCSIFKDNNITSVKPSKKTNLYLDTIGAGDYFLASFVYKRYVNIAQRMKLSNNYAFSKIIGKSKVNKY